VWVAGKGKELAKKLSEWQKKCLSGLENSSLIQIAAKK